MIGYFTDRRNCHTKSDGQRQDEKFQRWKNANNDREVKTATPDQSDGERSVDADVSAEDGRAYQRGEDLFPVYLNYKCGRRL